MRKIFKTTPVKEYELTPSPVFSATVVSVDIPTYTMKVRSKYFSGQTKRIDIPCLFFNVRDSSGAIAGVLPEVGAEVWLCKVADAEDEFVPLCYRGIIGDDGYRGGRPVGLPGDIILSTADGNYVNISKGGSVAMSSSPTCSMMLNPTDDSVYILSSQFKIYTLGMASESICDGGRRTNTVYKYFEIAEQDDPSVELIYGNTGSSFVYSKVVNGYNPDATITVNMGRDGYTRFEGHVTDVTASDLSVVSNNATVTNDRFQINSKQLGINMSVDDEEEDLDASVYVNCEDAHIDPSLLTVGVKESSDFLLKNDLLTSDLDTLLSALDAHSTAVATSLNSVGFPVAITLAPVTAAIQNMKAKLASGVYATNKLKSE